MSDTKELSKLERVEKASSIIKSIVTVIAVIVGAWWTVHTFSVLGQKAKADLELGDLSYREGVLNFEVKAMEQAVANDRNHYIEIVVQINNVGNSDVSLCFEDPNDKQPKTNCGEKADYPCEAVPGRNGLPKVLAPLHIARVISSVEKAHELVVDKDEDFTATRYREDCQGEPVPVTEMRVQKGQTESYTVGVVVHKTGLYHISFLAYVPDKEREREPTSKSFVPLSATAKPFWRAETFYVVGGASIAPLPKH